MGAEDVGSVPQGQGETTDNLLWLMRGAETPRQQELWTKINEVAAAMRAEGRPDINEFTVRQEFDAQLAQTGDTLSDEDNKWVEKYLHTPIDDREPEEGTEG